MTKPVCRNMKMYHLIHLHSLNQVRFCYIGMTLLLARDTCFIANQAANKEHFK